MVETEVETRSKQRSKRRSKRVRNGGPNGGPNEVETEVRTNQRTNEQTNKRTNERNCAIYYLRNLPGTAVTPVVLHDSPGYMFGIMQDILQFAKEALAYSDYIIVVLSTFHTGRTSRRPDVQTSRRRFRIFEPVKRKKSFLCSLKVSLLL